MARNKSTENSFADLVARLKDMSNMTPEQERSELLEAANNEPKVLDDKDISLADIAKLAGIKEYAEAPKVSPKAEKLVESITKADTKTESDITKAIKESDADDSIATNIKKAVTEETKRLDKIAELETQLAELKAQEKEEATMDDKAFREAFTKEMTEYVKEAEAQDLVELYNKFSANEVEMNEDSFTIKTPETSEIIADAEKAEAPDDQVVQEKEPEAEDMPVAEEPAEETPSEEPVEEDDGEGVEIELPVEDKFTNDLDPAEKK